MKKSLSNRLFDWIIILTVFIAILLTVIPFLNVVALSLSDPVSITKGEVSLYPIGFNTAAYVTVFKDPSMIRSLIYTIYLTALYVAISMFLTICAAYPLTKKRLKGRKVITLFMIFTMYFAGGIIPDYILLKTLKLTNTMWSLILPGAISAYNMVILKSFFEGIPESLEESARLDGAGDICVLVKIVLPLALPVLATLCLFYAVARWNTFQDALYYITNANLYPLQMKLKMLLDIAQSSELSQFEGANLSELVPENIKSASIVFATVPILVVYPWLQKYFVTGVTLGAVKE